MAPLSMPSKDQLKRFFYPPNIYSRLFLLVVSVEAIFDVACEAFILSRGELLRLEFGSSPVLAVYVGMFVFAHLVQLIFTLDAIHQRNTIQTMGLCVFNLLLMIYAIVQISEVKETFETQGRLDDSITVVTTLVPCVIGVCQIPFMFFTWKMSQDFGWDIYKNLGADRRIKRMFFQYQIFLCICKFDIVWVFGFCAQLVALVLKEGDYELYVTIAALPITLLVLAAAGFAAKREVRWLMSGVMAFVLLGFAYFAFKLFKIWQGGDQEYFAVRQSLTLFAGISLLFLLITEVQAFIVFRNFGKGLATSMRHQSNHKAAEAGFDDAGPHYQLESAKSSRMSID